MTAPLPLPLLFRGKVRDVHAVPGTDLLLLIASDRVSAFDVVMRERIPDKGRVLTAITAWWLAAHLEEIPHHLISIRDDEIRRAIPALCGHEHQWAGRSSLVRRTEPLPVECVVRGYISGSAWQEYRRSGTLAGEAMPAGLIESARLPAPLFSPATKAQEGHDRNIPLAEVAGRLGDELAGRLRDRSLAIFERGARVAAEREIILADTKFEFGIASDGELLLIDEVLTPDSSRFWPHDRYRPGQAQDSLDKQPIRDYLDTLADWNREPPPPPLPPAAIESSTMRYREIFQRLTGSPLHSWKPPRFAHPPGLFNDSDRRRPEAGNPGTQA